MKILAFQNNNFTEKDAAIGATPKWFTDGNCFVAFADGDPAQACWHYRTDMPAQPTPNAVSPSIARCVKFRLPKSITAANVRVFSIAAVALYRFAIYDATTGNRVWESGTISTAVNDWNAMPSPGLVLNANQDYWFCMTVSDFGGIAAFITFWPPPHANYYSAANSPLGALNIGLPVYAQFPVTSGNFPLTLPPLQAAAYATADTGTIPLPFITTF